MGGVETTSVTKGAEKFVDGGSRRAGDQSARRRRATCASPTAPRTWCEVRRRGGSAPSRWRTRSWPIPRCWRPPCSPAPRKWDERPTPRWCSLGTNATCEESCFTTRAGVPKFHADAVGDGRDPAHVHQSSQVQAPRYGCARVVSDASPPPPPHASRSLGCVAARPERWRPPAGRRMPPRRRQDRRPTRLRVTGARPSTPPLGAPPDALSSPPSPASSAPCARWARRVCGPIVVAKIGGSITESASFR